MRRFDSRLLPCAAAVARSCALRPYAVRLVGGPFRAALLGLVLAAVPSAAEPQGCRDFRTYMNAGVQLGVYGTEWEQALRQFEKAQSFTCSPEDDVKLQSFRGIVLFNMRRPGPARDAFRQALLLDPAATLPGNFGTKVSAFFDKVRAELPAPVVAPRAVEAKPTPAPAADEGKPGAAPSLRTASVSVDAPGAAVTAAEAAPRTAAAPRDAPVAPAITPRADPTAPLSVREPSASKRWVAPIVLGASALAALVGAMAFGLSSTARVADARRAEFMDELRRSLDQAGSQALVANVLFGGAGALSVGALVAALWPSPKVTP
ncbi:MAG: hypothetical protein INH41_14720 [Myxococcaceae bacterium]|jgi:hypothetical protein|nr:hypothetical protein [Myxococcaceae bacterium]MCA3013632.1 hypothetical protein [Myxococcaceae bacterium]